MLSSLIVIALFLIRLAIPVSVVLLLGEALTQRRSKPSFS